ncbi:uncharacterized protein LOC123678193 [Harmonia axyridis]|uniref:uncharacterized protein LOC123678193 n=1 Tax=Harmonia axyridis TaxID=115357 RepID=UPI001E27897A|nr:uncharacterized protein LOC123678193 [Harmonia axyridis]
MSAIIELMNSCSINDISGSLNTYYGDYDTLHYSLQILDGTVQSWELESEELIELIREDLEHPSHYEDIDEEYIRDAGGIIGHFLKNDSSRSPITYYGANYDTLHYSQELLDGTSVH